MKNWATEIKCNFTHGHYSGNGTSVSLPLSQWGLCSPLGKHPLKETLPFGFSPVGFSMRAACQGLSLLVLLCPVHQGRGVVSDGSSPLRSRRLLFFLPPDVFSSSAECLGALPFPRLGSSYAPFRSLFCSQNFPA